VPVPFPPFQITFANDALEPQRGTSVEAGIYHHAALSAKLSADLTLAAYRMSMRDEIDFDLQTFSYGNIGRSRHNGVEASIDLLGPSGLGASATWTLQSATARIGEHDGNQLKAIPRHFFTAGLRTGTLAGFHASLGVSGARDIWLDDGNTIELPGWTRWDARLAWTSGSIRVFADVHNLTDAEYSTTGFPDGADPGVIWYHPAAGRTFQIGIGRDW
jgi:Fe(3+) dicitrate transport protein